MSRLASRAVRVLLIGAVACALAIPACANAAESRFIVKLKDDATKAKVDPKQRLARVAEDAALALEYRRPMALGLHVVSFDGDLDASVIAARIASSPDVEWAEPDRKAFPALAPNDEFLGGQTYLPNRPGAINAYAAWDITTGSPSTVVAVVDTGYRPHEDLTGRLLPGYDFISDPQVANDGDGRDADASDPGDWISAADQGTDAFKDCGRSNSSWHGTGVAGIIGANTNNGVWVAGIDWQAKILPVRVLGKCGGFDSDIADGVAWAAGLPVPGAPSNPNPAQVINLSLGGAGSCRTVYRNVVAQALAAGNTKAIVAAAGNETDDVANHTPANCPGVIAVASTTTSGNLARYSNFGAGITISAPGGQFQANLGNDGVIVLSNSGTTSPVKDAFSVGGGTSYAAPMVSGTIALMLAADPQLTSAQIGSILLSTASAFPAGSTCDTTRCGPGIVNTAAAVAAAKALAPASPAIVTVIEYYNASLDHYFITWVPAEIAALDAGTTIKGWQRTGASFKVYSGAQAGTSPVCRYYEPPQFGDSHFFGRGTTECQQTGIKNPGFVLESSDFMDVFLPVNGACAAGTIPVYRVFSNRPDANHRYMIDRATRDAMVARGWLAEGDGPDLVVMCVPQ